jgi:hypothetical protein
MPIYSVHYFCNACSQVHPMGMEFELDLEIDDWATIQDIYAGHPVSRRLITIELNELQCPETAAAPSCSRTTARSFWSG